MRNHPKRASSTEYVVGHPVEVVGDGEADPAVGSLPSDLEIFEGCEFGSDILVAVSCSDGLENHRKVVVGYGAVLLVEGGDKDVTFGGCSVPHGFHSLRIPVVSAMDYGICRDLMVGERSG